MSGRAGTDLLTSSRLFPPTSSFACSPSAATATCNRSESAISLPGLRSSACCSAGELVTSSFINRKCCVSRSRSCGCGKAAWPSTAPSFAIERHTSGNSDAASSLAALRSLLRRHCPFCDLVVRAHSNATAQRRSHWVIFYFLCGLPHHLRKFSRTGCVARRRLHPWTVFFLFPDRDRNCVCRSRQNAPDISETHCTVILSRADGEGPPKRSRARDQL